MFKISTELRDTIINYLYETPSPNLELKVGLNIIRGLQNLLVVPPVVVPPAQKPQNKPALANKAKKDK